MTVAGQIREKINLLPKGKTFGYDDLGIDKSDYVSAAKALERFQEKGLIRKISKGVFYIPEQSVFGDLKPDYNELLKPYLFENDKRVAYVTGASLYNRLGLTRQIAFTIKIASRVRRVYINRGSLKVDAVKSYAEVDDSNYEILGLLDAFKDVKKIPDCSAAQAVGRLSAILNGMDDKMTETMIGYALLYPPRVRALVGAILQNIGCDSDRLSGLRNSLNPFTTVKIGIKDTDLPTKIHWGIV